MSAVPRELPFRRLLTVNEVAEWFGVDRRTIYRWLAEQAMPQPVKIGRTTRFRIEDIERHLATRPRGVGR